MKSFYKIIILFIITLLANSANAFDTIARSSMVIDQTTGTVLMAKDADRRVPPASMSKLMLQITYTKSLILTLMRVEPYDLHL